MTADPTSIAHTLTPYLAVRDARAAIDWYVEVLGAAPSDAPIVMPDGRIGHAELTIAGSRLMLSDEHGEIDVLGPQSRGGTTVTLHLEIPDVDGTVQRAVERGATLEREPVDEPYGRTGVIRDPFGHRWMLQQPLG
jgi:uncharacterized glyoxalase superfamily protein PhnB